MIPERIKLTNFGAISQADVDLRDVSLAVVVGANGVGKSTLFTTAPMWALFGVTRSGAADDVVRTGTNECSVAFDFEHQGAFYRVVRTRTVNGRGKTTLELIRRHVDGSFESLSGTTIRETEEKIQALLHLDAEMFAASSMIMQGRANEFTDKAPGQRKAILAQILGLEVYDRLLDEAKKGDMQAERDYSACLERRADMTARREALPSLQASESRLSEQLSSFNAELSCTEELIQGLMQEVYAAQNVNEKLKDLRTRKAELEVRGTVISAKRCKHRAEIAAAEQFLRQEDEILQAAEACDEAREQLPALKIKNARREELRSRYVSLQEDISGLYSAERGCVWKINNIQEQLEERTDIEFAVNELKNLSPLLEKLQAKESRAMELEKQISQVAAKLAEARSKCSAMEARIAACNAQAERFAAAGCVAPEAAETSPCRFIQDAVKAKAELPGLNKQLSRLQQEEEVINSEVCELRMELSELKYDPSAIADVQKTVTRCQTMAAKVESMEAKEQLLASHKEKYEEICAKGDELTKECASIQEEGQLLADEIAQVGSIEEVIHTLSPMATQRDQLPLMHEKLRHSSEQLRELEPEEVKNRQDMEAVIREIEAAGSVDEASISSRMEQERACKIYLNARISECNRAIGKVRTDICALEDMGGELAELEKKTHALAGQGDLWSTLVRAFGKNGIPAFIIENAVPELERISNEVLCQMSGGHHTLRFETQRDLKSKAGMMETLDIIVSDWQGARPYETYSGGEQLRIDLAIRIALADLLANRAGNKIEWLIIDEGLGSQDDAHRGTVMEAVKSISGRFRKVMVITHVKEAQGLFPQIIELKRSDVGLDVTIG